MEDISTIRLRQLHGQLGEVVYQLTRVQFSQFSARKTWHPAINAYRCRDCIIICVDLAGVDQSLIDLRVEGRRLLIRGRRPAVEPLGGQPQALQILAMEIDDGPFERELALPLDVVPERTTAEQRNGLLWIYLPLRTAT